jgi:hypothetical protein
MRKGDPVLRSFKNMSEGLRAPALRNREWKRANKAGRVIMIGRCASSAHGAEEASFQQRDAGDVRTILTALIGVNHQSIPAQRRASTESWTQRGQLANDHHRRVRGCVWYAARVQTSVDRHGHRFLFRRVWGAQGEGP